jgi:uncharacterized RDD family membrane protein YckC
MTADPVSASDSGVFYPRLIRRVRAMVIDSMIAVVILFAWLLALPYFPEGNVVLKVGVLLLAFFVLEPVLVALTGGTPGHHFMGIRVRDAKAEKKLGILRSTLRAFVKGVLGWLSFILVMTTAKHQAIHDFVTSSVVILKNAQDVPPYDRLEARHEETQAYDYPSRTRRVAVIVLYNSMAFILMGVALPLTISNACLLYDRCAALDNVMSVAISTAWLAWVGLSIVLGWRGMFYGCRRKVRESQEGST